MAKLNEAEIRRALLNDFPENVEYECGGKIKVRVCDIDRFVTYIVRTYNQGFKDGGDKMRREAIKLLTRDL